MEFVEKSSVSLIDHMGDDLDVAMAAWVSTSGDKLPDDIQPAWRLREGFQTSDDIKSWERVEALENFLYRERHMSPFEHTSLKFYIDTPIFVAREFMRHRTFSYNETSGRYRELEPRFFLVGSERPLVQTGKVGAYRFVPGSDEQYGTVFAATSLAYKRSWEAYQDMLAAGVAKEVARNVLPVGIMTSFYVTGNLRNWFQFLLLRNDPNALEEIRNVAVEIEEHVETKFPRAYAAFKKYDYRDERAELNDLRKKVAQYEAEETYSFNIGLEVGHDERVSQQTELIKKRTELRNFRTEV